MVGEERESMCACETKRGAEREGGRCVRVYVCVFRIYYYPATCRLRMIYSVLLGWMLLFWELIFMAEDKHHVTMQRIVACVLWGVNSKRGIQSKTKCESHEF